MYYDPAEVKYETLLDIFFQRVDPTTLNRQGNDSGTQYRSVIYYHTEAQKEAAEKVGAAGGRRGRWLGAHSINVGPGVAQRR